MEEEIVTTEPQEEQQPQQETEVQSQQEPEAQPQKAAEAQPEQGSDQWFAQDERDFGRAYPDVDREALFADPHFLDYAEGKVGKLPLGDIYAGYQRLRDALGQAAARTQEARKRATGSLKQNAVDSEAEYYTLAEMQAMSTKYIEEHWDKVQRSLAQLR